MSFALFLSLCPTRLHQEIGKYKFYPAYSEIIQRLYSEDTSVEYSDIKKIYIF